MLPVIWPVIYWVKDTFFLGYPWVFLEYINRLSYVAVFFVSIYIVGKTITPVLEHSGGSRYRVMDERVMDTLGLIVKRVDADDYYRFLKRLSLIFFLPIILLPCIFLVESIMTSPPDQLTYMYIVNGETRGYIALLLFVSAKILVHIFWILAGASLGYVLWTHIYILDVISRMISKEMISGNALILNKRFHEILGEERPATALLRFREKLTMSTQVIGALIKRTLIALLLAALAVAGYQVRFTGYTHMLAALAIDATGILIIVGYGVYVITKISSKLQQLFIIEIKDIRISAIKEKKPSLEKTTWEIEELIREMKHPLIPSRELWEVVAAILSLTATILAFFVKGYVT